MTRAKAQRDPAGLLQEQCARDIERMVDVIAVFFESEQQPWLRRFWLERDFPSGLLGPVDIVFLF